MKPEFVHLHCHSEYSLLDGLAHPRQIAERARALGQPGVALTDHGVMFAAIEFYDACLAAGVKPIVGIEAYLARRSRTDRDPKLDRDAFHLLLLAENETGYHNLMQLATAAQLEGFYYYPRVDHELLAKYSEGVICTTGCLSAQVPDLLKSGRPAAARQALAWYREVFGDRFYIELQDHKLPELDRINPTLLEFAREFNVPVVATNDVHYIERADANAQDILLCIQTNKTVLDTDRMRMTSDDYYFKSSEEMAELWRHVPQAIQNTVAVAERCQLNLSSVGYHLPLFPVPEGYSPESYLRALCEEGARGRYPRMETEARERIEYELRVIHEMGFDTYFLIVWDLTHHAREQGIWYNVRGSAASSIVAYCLGITNLDPLPHHLVFERFLNPGRVSMPDIDLDFPDDGRGQMIDYTVRKYGRDRVAQIITFGKLLAKAALRDVGRALDYPLSEVDRVAKLIPGGPGQTIAASLETVPEFRELHQNSESLRTLIDTARLLEGVTRHASTHAAGVVVADKPIVEYTPLHRSTRDAEAGFPVTQYSMGDLEHIGLLKIDFLGLATLTIMRRACEMIEGHYGVHYDLNNIPVEDGPAFELLSRGDVLGVFQVEGAGMRRVLTGMRPNRFDHIVATISLFRPGPMDYIPTYIKRMHGEEPITYAHPLLEPILDETYGVVVYQEQILRTAMSVCGYSAAEADLLRKAVGKKKKEELLAQREKFIAGAQNHGGVPAEIAEKLFDDLAFFARYGFNKAHAADYAVLTCQTAFLKAHYPLEYMCALLTNEIGNLDKMALLAAEARRTRLELLPPDVRYSGAIFEIDYERAAIRFGLSAIKNVGEGPARTIAAARQAGGPFTSLDDFCQRVDLRQVNKRVLESLVRAGSLDGFGERAQLLAVAERMLSASSKSHAASELGQLSLFGTTTPGDTFGALPPEPPLSNREKLEAEKELTGVYFSEHALTRIARTIRHHTPVLSGDLAELDGQMVTLGGVVTSSRIISTKKGDAMAFVQFEDPQGTVELVLFPKTYRTIGERMTPQALLLVEGKVQLREGKVSLLLERVRDYPEVEAGGPAASAPEAEWDALVSASLSVAAPAAKSPPAHSPAPAASRPTLAFSITDSDDIPDYDEQDRPSLIDQDRLFAAPPQYISSTRQPGDVATPTRLPASGTQPLQAKEPDSPEAAVPRGGTQVVNTVDGSQQLGAEQDAKAQEPAESASVQPPPAPISASIQPLPSFKVAGGIPIPSKSNPSALQVGSLPRASGAPPRAGGSAPRAVGYVSSSAAAARSAPVSPRAAEPGYGAPGRRLHIRLLQRTPDFEEDKKRLRELIHLLKSQPGTDHFYFYIPNALGLVQLDFPNFTTDYAQVETNLSSFIEAWAEIQVE